MSRDLSEILKHASPETLALNADLVLDNQRRKKKDKNKYGNVEQRLDGHKFDSKAEARRYGELKLMEQAGEISELETQPYFVLQYGFTDQWGRRHRAITYKADFKYLNEEDGIYVVEDVKGGNATITDASSMRLKMAQFANPGIKFVFVKR